MTGRRMWVTATGGKEIRAFNADFATSAVFFTLDGRWVLTGVQSGAGRLLDSGHTGSGNPHLPGACRCTVRPIAISPDGKQVLTGSEDETARLWEVVRRRRGVTVFQGAALQCFRRTGRQVFTAGSGKPGADCGMQSAAKSSVASMTNR